MLKHLNKGLFFLGLAWATIPVMAVDLITREYRLKNADAAVVIQVIKFAVPNITEKRLMGGQDKKLVITDAIEQQEEIAQLLPILDQPSKETDPHRRHFEMITWAANYYAHKKRAATVAQAPASGSSAKAADSGSVHTYDTHKTTQAYKSVYTDEDVKLMKGPRVVHEDPVLPSVAGLTLKGIFRVSTGSPLALLSYGSANFTARDGGLFENNRTRVKGVVTQVLKDHVLITGPDKVPREIKFKSSL